MYYYKEETMDEIIGEMRTGIRDIVAEFDKIINMENVLSWLMKYDGVNIHQSDLFR